jgi:hypothetical protein
MARNNRIAVLLPLIASLLAAETFAQAPEAVRSALARTIPERTRADFTANNHDVWDKLSNTCGSVTPMSQACAYASIVAVSEECGASAKWFKKSTGQWQWLGFSLLIASAAFTGVGASTTIANAKVYSTLGGTTALGAVTSTINSNAAGDQTGLASVNKTLSSFLTFVQGNGTPPSNLIIFQQAPIYGEQCESAANGSTSGGSKSPSPKSAGGSPADTN